MDRTINILSRALTPRFAGEAFRKAVSRLNKGQEAREAEVMSAWCAASTSDAAVWANAIDPALWKEAEAFADDQEARTVAVAQKIKGFGGAGFYSLLYFLVRMKRPSVVVETGVAAGFSSRAVLKAMTANGEGHLWSSDLPYLGGQAPEDMIGVMVEDELRARWTLLTDGDRANLPKILKSIDHVDLFHYDSDKTAKGRQWAFDLVAPLLSPNAIVVFDDIQDNCHFRDFVAHAGRRYVVFSFAGKWIGLVEWGAPVS